MDKSHATFLGKKLLLVLLLVIFIGFIIYPLEVSVNKPTEHYIKSNSLLFMANRMERNPFCSPIGYITYKREKKTNNPANPVF